MIRRTVAMAAVLVSFAVPAFAQAHTGDISFTAGWTFSDGVSFTDTTINGVSLNRADPKDSVSFGLSGAFFTTDSVSIEFMWNRQKSKLEVTGSNGATVNPLGATYTGDMNVDNYHGYVLIHGGAADSKVRPFFMFGAGATNFGDAKFPSHTLNGFSKFSFSMGAGVKIYPSPHAGFRAQVRWVPTYIKTDAVGWWCDPYWGYCGPAGNTQYSNQFELSGGITLRFGNK